MSATLTKNVVAGADDGYWDSTGGGFNATGDVIGGDVSGVSRNGFIRFVAVPGLTAGAHIESATLTLSVFTFAGVPTLKVRGVKEANPSTIASAADANGRSLTTAGVDWDTAGTAGTITSPDISTVIQELVSQAAWNGGNALLLVILNDSSPTDAKVQFRAYEEDPSGITLTLAITQDAEGHGSARNLRPHTFEPRPHVFTPRSSRQWEPRH